jgi:hypothetical protein
MALVGTCEAKKIQANSKQSLMTQATQDYNASKSDYMACLGPQEQGAEALEDAKSVMDKLAKEADTLTYIDNFILKQLGREVEAGSTLSTLADLATGESEKLREEIDQLKTDIRTERRRFLDASPSSSPAVAGLYFTSEPDNQVLLLFLTCFGAFLLFTSLLLMFNKIPIQAIQSLTDSERIILIAASWVLAIIMMYVGFFSFT